MQQNAALAVAASAAALASGVPVSMPGGAVNAAPAASMEVDNAAALKAPQDSGQ